MSRVFYVGLVMSGLVLCSGTLVQAGRQAPNSSATAQADAERGRAVFNGKGVCYYCHGIDGNRDQEPQLETGTAALIAQLDPSPPDLRKRKTLRLTTDKARFNAIREGHPGTGMFPDTTMTTQELTDTLAFLALLRSEGAGGKVHRSR
jgi:cytochrome c peroxidase